MKYFYLLRFINGAGFVSAAIDWATNSLWDHTEGAFMVESNFVTGWIGAHDKGGVEERPLDYCRPTRERRYRLELTAEQYTKMRAFAKAKIGTPYNFADILGLLVHERHIESAHREICSQFQIDLCDAGGIWLLNVEPEYNYLITPETLHLSPVLRGRGAAV